MESEGLAMAHRVHSNFSFHNSNDTKSLALLVQVLYLRCLVHVKTVLRAHSGPCASLPFTGLVLPFTGLGPLHSDMYFSLFLEKREHTSTPPRLVGSLPTRCLTRGAQCPSCRRSRASLKGLR